MGFSVVTPPWPHEHWCGSCSDYWRHSEICEAARMDYECPEHQPRSGTFYESWAGSIEGTGGHVGSFFVLSNPFGADE